MMLSTRFVMLAATVCSVLFGYQPAAQAWRATVCDSGQIRGMRSGRTFVLDRQNIPAGSGREAAILHMFGQWNALPSIHGYFNWAAGNADGNANGDDWVHYVTRASIEGAHGRTTFALRPCLFNAPNDGRAIDVKIRIADDLPVGPSAETWLPDLAAPSSSLRQTARGALHHEMGHALGGEHDTRMANMLYNPNWGSLKVGARSADGTLANRTDTFIADDLYFANTYHGDEATELGADWAVSTQAFVNNATINLHASTPKPLQVCRGTALSFNFTVINRGYSAAQVPLIGVLSSDSIIRSNDVVIANWTVWPAFGQYATFLSDMVVPALPNGDYFLGAVIDPNNTIAEYDEGNNSVWLNAILRIVC